MAVDPKDRERFEHGLEVNKTDFLSRFISDQASYWLDSESERAAYDKARRGETLDEDKKDE